ncbi:hypothetical protein BDV93DRAFT_407127, partial [Ceratobasidium sp. AG-I]
GIQVRVEWCPGHAGIRGSGVADRLAREASGGTECGGTDMPRGTKHPRVLAHTFIDKIKNLPRSRASLLFQLTIGHVPLQAHLARLRAADSNVCPHCSDAPETVAHFILRCPVFASERH